jgi:hypothetical protein
MDQRPRLSTRLFITAFIAFISLLFSYSLIQGMWETVSLECQPSSFNHQTNCHLHQETYPGQSKDINIAKDALVQVKVLSDATPSDIAGHDPRGLVFITAAGKEIPLTRSLGGVANEQLLQYFDAIDQFIRDPQQQKLSVKTQRSWLFWAISGVVLLFDGIIMTVIWQRRSSNNFYKN